MAEDVIAEIRHILQDILVPDFKALSVRLDANQRYTELAIKALEAKIDASRAEMDASRSEIMAFRAEMSAFRAEMRSEFQAQRNLLQNEVLCETLPIRERLATLEAQSAHS